MAILSIKLGKKQGRKWEGGEVFVCFPVLSYHLAENHTPVGTQ